MSPLALKLQDVCVSSCGDYVMAVQRFRATVDTKDQLARKKAFDILEP
jgi:hypothetical protein